jgi:hypothetical protein
MDAKERSAVCVCVPRNERMDAKERSTVCARVVAK